MANKSSAVPWAKYEPRELRIKRKTPPNFEQWASLMFTFNTMAQSSPFWRGDLYLKGEEWFGEDRATSIFEPGPWNLKTWQNNASVCRHVEPSRRREELSYSHHAEVAYLDPALQEQYLQTAIDNMLNVRQLRELVRSEQGDANEDRGEDVEFETRGLGEFLKGEADKIERRLNEASGEIRALMTTAVESLRDAHKLSKEGEADD